MPGARRSASPIPASLGWELHHPIEMQNYLWDQLMAAGEKHGLKLVGARAQNWLRQEKSYRAFGTELGRDATPLEAGSADGLSIWTRTSTARTRW